MKVLVDTSVLVAACVAAHPDHARAVPVIAGAGPRDFEIIVGAHSLAETYAVFTRLPLRPRITPEHALALIRENVLARAQVVPLSAADYVSVLEFLSVRGLAGGVTYDALIIKAGQLAGVDCVVTLNVDDFRRCWPEEAHRVMLPEELLGQARPT